MNLNQYDQMAYSLTKYMIDSLGAWYAFQSRKICFEKAVCRKLVCRHIIDLVIFECMILKTFGDIVYLSMFL